jgi:hypothetical protein
VCSFFHLIHTMIRRQLLIAASLVAAAVPLQTWAQTDYPNKPIKLIVPFPAGGTSDVMGRLIADELGKGLKQSVVVETPNWATTPARTSSTSRKSCPAPMCWWSTPTSPSRP